MKFLIALFLLINSAQALDYDPEFHIKHRYNKHEEVLSKIESIPTEQKIEASETSEEPLKTTPETRKFFKQDQQRE
jgi:hypothetical protein